MYMVGKLAKLINIFPGFIPFGIFSVPFYVQPIPYHRKTIQPNLTLSATSNALHYFALILHDRFHLPFCIRRILYRYVSLLFQPTFSSYITKILLCFSVFSFPSFRFFSLSFSLFYFFYLARITGSCNALEKNRISVM